VLRLIRDSVGPVVQNVGEMNKSTVVRLIKAKFGEIKKQGDWVNVNCPYCIFRRPAKGVPDKEFKLGINIESGWYSCFRCQAKGKLSLLFPQLDSIAIAAEEVIQKTEQKETTLEQLPPGVKLSELEGAWKEIVYDLLLSKEFSPAALENITYFCQDYKKQDFSFGPRLIFPIYQFGSYRGFQGRTVYKNTLPKYIGASNMDRKSILYGYDEAFAQQEELIITEGFLDKIRVGQRAVAALGKNITENQLRLVRLGTFKKVVTFLDKDARLEAIETARKIALFFPSYIADPDWINLRLLSNGERKKDPGDLNREEIDHILRKNLERIY